MATIKVTAGAAKWTAADEGSGGWHDVAVSVDIDGRTLAGEISIENGRPVGDSTQCWISADLLRAINALPDADAELVVAQLAVVGAQAAHA